MNDEMTRDERAVAHRIADNALNEAHKAENAQDANVARHHAAKAQKFYDQLHEMLDSRVADDVLEKREGVVATAVELAFDQVCVLRDVEKKAKVDREQGRKPLDPEAAAAVLAYEIEEGQLLGEGTLREVPAEPPFIVTGDGGGHLDYNEYRRSQIGSMGLEQAAGLTREDMEYGNRQVRLDKLREEFLVTTSEQTVKEDEETNCEIDEFTFLLSGPMPTVEQIRQYRYHGGGSREKRSRIEGQWRQMEGLCEIAWIDPNKPLATALGLENATDDLNPAIGRIRVAFRHYQTKEINGYSEPMLCCAEHAKWLEPGAQPTAGPDWEWLKEPAGDVTKQEADQENIDKR